MAESEIQDGAEAIAIVGMAGRFPGANTIHEFWRNLQNGVESIRFFKDDELQAAGVDLEAIRNDSSYVRARGILSDPGPQWFDAAFFGIQPKEAEVMDPQQRLFLETAWEALESAGCDPEKYPGVVGVFAGMTKSSYFLNHLLGRSDLAAQAGDSLIFMGNDKDYLTTRVSYKLNLKGPSVNISNACSTSLVAVCQAWQSLLNYQCDMALAGGVSITVPQERGYYFQEGNIASPDGHCRTFDADAQGTLFSNGVGIVVLKRLSEALNDGDHIWAVIKGAAVNNDGAAKVSFAAPSVDGQAEVITLAQAIAGVDAASISYVEAHGTATPLGDPIEIAGLTQAFRASTDGRNFCAVGSVKSNIGHLDVASGIAGLIKTTLALWHKQLPPSLHFERPNPKIDFANSPFFVNTELKPWSQGEAPRRAGVSSFGTGSTNAHVILEEAPEPIPAAPARKTQLLALSAKSTEALDQAASNLARYLETNPEQNLADVAYTLQTGRRGFAYRRALLCHDQADAVAALVKPGAKRQALSTAPAVAFMFPGQGAQYLNMARGLYEERGVFYNELNSCAESLAPRLGLDIRKVLYPDHGSAAAADINATGVTQPALFAVEYALAQQWLHWGIRPSAVIGHSLGEYVGACLAGVLSRDDALMLLAERARLMQSLPTGAMLAVRLSQEALASRLSNGLSIAAVNSPVLTMISGPDEAIQTLVEELAADKIVCKKLATSHAFHSAMLEPILKPYSEIVRQVKFAAPQIPWVSSYTGVWITSTEVIDAEYWVQQMRQPVRFADALSKLLEGSLPLLLEVGPGRALSTFARQLSEGSTKVEVLTSLANEANGERDLDTLLHALGGLWSAGAAIDWPAVHDHQRRRRVPLPTYPFERKYFWVEPLRTHTEATPVHSTATMARDEAKTPSAAPTVAAASKAKELAMTPTPNDVSSSAVPDSAAHRQNLLGALQALFSEISGLPLSTLEPTISFIELGLDSLILTQASTAIQKRLGVNIKFRQLLEELGCLAALADRLAQLIPAPAPARTTESQTAEVLAAPRMALPKEPGQSGAGSLESNALERIFARQLDLMQQQIDMLRQGAATALNVEQAPPVATAAMAGPEVQLPAKSMTESRGFGPYRPVNKGTSGGLSHGQAQALRDLSERYIAKTKKSKEMTADYRPYLADPRAVSGFRALWKELVYPIVTERSAGSKLWDIDGNEYIDLTSGFGSIFFGHAPAFVTEALRKQLEQGMEIGPQSPLAGKVAKLLCELTGLERAAFCNTGSEAVLAAMRMARTVTGRDKIATFSGDYHGIFDEVIVRGANRSDELRSVPAAPGIPASATQNMIVLDHEDPRCLEILRAHAHELAAVIVEPVQGRRVDFQPKELFQQIRKLTGECGIALIFDEVITGFRTHLGGMQAVYGIKADIATYGKVIGGGFPIGVVAGNAHYMDALDGGTWKYGDDSAPEVGMTYFAGTFVRHPLALAAAWACLNYLKEQGPVLQDSVNQRTARLVEGLRAAADAAQVPVRIPHFSSVFAVEFPADFAHAGLFYVYMRDKGIHIWEGRSWILTTAHSDADVEKIVNAFKESLAEMQAAGFLPTVPSATPPPGNRRDQETELSSQFPMTDGQRELWLAAQLSDEASRAFADTVLLRLRGRLDFQAMVRAVNEVVARHDALRAVFDPLGNKCTIVPEITVEVPFEDVSDLAGSIQAERLDSIAREENRKSFALDCGPLLRARVVKCGPEDHTLILTTHHIAVDGWSHGVLFGDLELLYAAACTNAASVPETPKQFTDYARWQETPQLLAKRSADEAYWLAQFAEPVQLLDLPTDWPRPATRTYRGGQNCLVLPLELCQSMREFAVRQRVTLFATLLAGFNVLLHRLSGQADFAVAISAAGQLAYDAPNLIGHCVNFLPLRVALDPKSKFAEYIAQVRAQLLDAFEHQNYTYGSLLQKINLPRDARRPPLVSVSFNVEKIPAKSDFHDLHVSRSNLPRAAVSFDSEINVVDAGNEIVVQWQYNADLFDTTTIQRFLRSYQVLLEAGIAGSDCALAKLSLLTPYEKQRAVIDGNITSPLIEVRECFHRLFEEQVERTPDTIAVSCEGDQLTYRQLDRRANQLARYLQKSGAAPEVLVAICLNRSIDMVVGLLAILKSGAAYLPLDPESPRQRLQFMVEDSRAPLLLAHSSLETKLPNFAGHKIFIDQSWDEISKESDRSSSVTVSLDQLAYVIYTSGSTGKPKGAMITHRGLSNYLQYCVEAYPLSRGRGALVHSTIAFDATITGLFGPLLAGRAVYLLPRTDDISALSETLLRMRDFSIVKITPAHLTLLNQQISASEAAGLSHSFVIGGENLTADQIAFWRTNAPETLLFNEYGPTETVVGCVVFEASQWRQSGSVPIGRPISNTQLWVLDQEQQPVVEGVVGELYIGGAGVARGYLHRTELTAERFVPNSFASVPGSRFYRTGDLVRRRRDGQLEFIGRTDSQVKIRGFRVELGEIEAALSRLENVRECAVAVWENPPNDKRLIGYVVNNDGVSPDTLKNQLRSMLPDYMIPTRFVLMDALPLTANGKIDRKALPQPEATRGASGAEFVEARTANEERIADIWREILGLDRVGIHDNFFDLGGHSLLAVRVVAKVRDACNHDIPLQWLFQYPTVAALVEKLQVGKEVPAAPAIVKEHLSIVEFEPGKRGQPVFFLPGAEGGDRQFVTYAKMAHCIDGDYAFYGLKARSAAGTVSAQSSVEEMASDYIGEIMSVQPEGPYYLVGDCIGGIVAYELAQQLKARGHRIGALILLDTDRPTRSASLRQWWNENYYIHRVGHHLGQLSRLGATEWPKYVVEKIGAQIKTRTKTEGEDPSDGYKNFIVQETLQSYERALLAYRPQPYHGAVTMIVTEASYRADPNLGWGDIIRGEIVVCKVSGEHETYIRENYLEVATVLRDCLDRSRGSREIAFDTSSDANLGCDSRLTEPTAPWAESETHKLQKRMEPPAGIEPATY